MTSAREQVLVGRAGTAANVGEPISSSPSTNTVTPTPELVAEHAQGADVRDHARPCRRRRRDRRGGRRARSARTAGCPSRRRPRAAGRRGARTAARSARPRAPGRRPTTAGAPDGTDRTCTSSRPAPRSSATTASALAATCAWSNSALETLGMRTRASRSARRRAERGGGPRTQRVRPVGRAGWTRSGQRRSRTSTLLDYPGGVFGRSNDPQPVTPALTESTPPPTDAGKGRPTPKRKVSEAANKRPLVAPGHQEGQPRAGARRSADIEYRAMQTGDERNMPAKDRGPVAPLHPRLGRRPLEPRRVLPAGGRGVPRHPVRAAPRPGSPSSPSWRCTSTSSRPSSTRWLMWRGLKKRLVAKFGIEQIPRGAAMYAVLRAFQIRRVAHAQAAGQARAATRLTPP